MRYPRLAFEIEPLEIIGRKLGQPLCAEDRRKSLIAFRHFGMCRRGAGIGGLAAHFPLVQLAAREIMTFGFPDHLPRTQNSKCGSTNKLLEPYWASGPMTLWTSLMLMTGGRSHWAIRSRSTCSLGARKTQ